MAGEAVGVDRGAGDDDLQVGALRQQLPEVAEDEVDVEAALVGLVDDQRVVAPQHPVALDLGEQDAVGHHLDERGLAHLVGEPHRVADVGRRAVDPSSSAIRSAIVRAATRRGWVCPIIPSTPRPASRHSFGQLGALARPGLAGDDHHLVVADRGEQLVAPLGDRQRLGVPQATTVDDGDRRSAARMIGRLGHGGSVDQPGTSDRPSHPEFPVR